MSKENGIEAARTLQEILYTQGLSSDEVLQWLVNRPGGLEMVRQLVGLAAHDRSIQGVSASSAQYLASHAFRGTSIANAEDVIFVPNLCAKDLIMLAKGYGDLRVYQSYADWNFYLDRYGNLISGPGTYFVVKRWKPGREVFSEEVLAYFERDKFCGHAGAFTAWVKDRMPMGYYVSVPELNACWYDADGSPRVPYASLHSRGIRELGHEWRDDEYGEQAVFVAFCQLST